MGYIEREKESGKMIVKEGNKEDGRKGRQKKEKCEEKKEGEEKEVKESGIMEEGEEKVYIVRGSVKEGDSEKERWIEGEGKTVKEIGRMKIRKGN